MNARRVTPWCMLAVLACGGDSATAPHAVSLLITGRAERGLIVHVNVQLAGDTTVTTASAITVTPADAATVLANGDVSLAKAGPLTVTGSTADGRSASTVVTVALPPTIVFDGLATGNRDVYRMSLDGQDLKRLTTNVSDDVHPSATGSIVVFNSYRDGNSELYAMTIDGTNEKRLTTSASNEAQPALSADGKRVAYSTNVSGFPRVWLATLDLASAAPLSATAALSDAAFGSASTVEASPAWAPASDRLALMTTATPTGGAGLFTANAAAHASPALMSGSGTQIVEVEPSWSFDGFRIVYAAANAGVTELWVRDLRTAAITQLTTDTGSSGQPAWLPDGRVVFTTFNGQAATLRWVDPAFPTVLHAIPTPGLLAEHAAPVRP
ncbi:MAG: hypothetical protein ABJE10_24325 [bacterium]